VGPQRYSINCPRALLKASQPTSHWHVISYQQTGQHLSLVEGGSRASSAPLPPRNTHPTKTARSHFPSEGGQHLSPVIELGTPDLHPRRGAALLCTQSLVQQPATHPPTLLRRHSPQPSPAPHGQRAQSKASHPLPSEAHHRGIRYRRHKLVRGPGISPSPWHQVPTAQTGAWPRDQPITVASGTDGTNWCVAQGPTRAERETCFYV